MGSLDLKFEEEGGNGIAKRLWGKLKNERALALYSPFVVGLASATLDPTSFLNSISQDVYFLQAFANAYELAEDYADDDDDKEAIFKLRKRVLKRLRDQDALIHEWGFEPPNEIACDNLTTKYTEFLKETAAGKVGGEKFSVNIVTPFEKTKLAAYTLSAIAPCMRLYSYISKEILALPDPEKNENIYKKWLTTLSSPKFEAAASRIEDLLDKLSISLTGEELYVVERIYHQAMKLELEFIWTQSVAQQTIVPFSQIHNIAKDNLIVFCDFDLTCSTVDSSALLAELAIVARSNGSEPHDSQIPYDDLRTTWNNLFYQYVGEYQECIDSITSIEAVEGLDYEGLHKALEQVSGIERNASSRMINSNLLKGINMEDITQAGEHLTFQDGCKKFFQDIQTKNPTTDVHVLSYCWSGDLISSAFSSGDLKAVNVHSNDLVYEGSNSTGNLVTKMESPMNKLQSFNNICSTKESKPTTVYIGGSVGDLLCLLEADVGIVIGFSTSLMRLGKHFGVSFVPLFSGLISKQRDLSKNDGLNCRGTSSILYTVSSWDEIYAFFLGR